MNCLLVWVDILKLLGNPLNFNNVYIIVCVSRFAIYNESMKYVVVSFLISLYVIIWVTCLFILIGFLMPNPARLTRSISGSNKRKKREKSYSNQNLEKDDYLFYETIDD